jgi:isopenicillin N synthase-like dioxygenase
MVMNFSFLDQRCYCSHFRRVAKSVARIIALALDLDVDFFDRPEMLAKPIATLRLLHYEGRVSNPAKGVYGAGAHSDYGLITLLATDDVVGLQVIQLNTIFLLCLSWLCFD